MNSPAQPSKRRPSLSRETLLAAARHEEEVERRKLAMVHSVQTQLAEALKSPRDGESKEWLSRLGRVQEVVCRHWPRHWPNFDACLSAYSSLLLNKITQGLGLVLIGESGAGKGTILDPFQNVRMTVWRSRFTPASILSGFADHTTKDQVEARALFKMVKHKVLVSGDLGPIMSGNRETLNALYNIIPPWMDGAGFIFDTGTHGAIGAMGDYTFVMIGGKTPFYKETWKAMATAGPRFLFLRVARLSQNELVSSAHYADAKAEVRDAVEGFLNWVFDRFAPRSIPWPEMPPAVERRIARYSELIALGQTLTGEQGDVLQVTPNHLTMRMAILVSAHALLWQRSVVGLEDLKLARRFVAGSAPGERGRILLALDSGLHEVSQIMAKTGLQYSVLYNTLIDLERVRVVRRSVPEPGPLRSVGRPAEHWEFAPQSMSSEPSRPMIEDDDEEGLR